MMAKIFISILLLVASSLCALGQGFSVSGKIYSEQSESVLPGASVVLKGHNVGVTADSSGSFRIRVPAPGSVLVISFIGYQKKEIVLASKPESALHIELSADFGQLSEVVVSSGYQRIAPERATGSFSHVDQRLFNRRVGSDVLSRLEDLVPGLVVNRSGVRRPGAQSSISIRGQSTIFAREDPLIILDNFPFTGDVSQINPNDVESVSVLKDAAAASIWGAQSGNGVIVITTKKGKFDSRPQLSFNSNLTLSAKPDQFYLPQISTAEYIDLERSLFARGYYNAIENSDSKSALSPVVELLIAHRDGKVSEQDLNSAIRRLSANDVRRDYDRYLNRVGVSQQYAVGLKGGGASHRYNLSAGYDKGLSTLVGNQTQRVTLSAASSYLLFKDKLEISTGLYYTLSSNDENALIGADLNYGSGRTLYPYARLTDDSGNPAFVTHTYREAFVQQARQQQLLDWRFSPLQEIAMGNTRNKANDYRFNTQFTYHFSPWLSLDVLYQYNGVDSERRELQSKDSWQVRDMINRFTSVSADGSLIRPVPVGDILDLSAARVRGHNARAQFNVNKQLGARGQLDGLVGAELRHLGTNGTSNRFYGYDDQLATSTPVDYLSNFTSYVDPSSKNNRIVDLASVTGLTDRYISWYGNASYSYLGKYTLSASARLDQSNLFGVKANQRGVPLYSIGGSWKASQEKFYKIAWLPYLALRATFGYNGNVDRTVSAYTTARSFSASGSGTDYPYSTIINPPNPELRWERVRMINLATDFRLKGNRITGSLEFYLKKAIDLIGTAPLAPQTGSSTLRGNSAQTRGQGVELSLTTRNFSSKVTWDTDLLLSYSADKVTRYLTKPASVVSAYLTGGSLVPAEGRPLYGVYSYQWAGLDPQTGDPLGYLAGEVSSDYTAIQAATSMSDLLFNGPQRPVVFGSLRNTWGYKGFSLSANISYRFGYAVRYPSVDYGSILSGNGGHSDYSLRWQQPGDEIRTHVPSMPQQENLQRTALYTYSDVLVKKGDHLRLQDVNLSYTIPAGRRAKSPFSSVQIYGYVNNLGLIWKRAPGDLDPDYPLTPPPSRTASLGIKASF